MRTQRQWPEYLTHVERYDLATLVHDLLSTRTSAEGATLARLRWEDQHGGSPVPRKDRLRGTCVDSEV